eukprot:2831139-Heterocapsa_arctica.AAC.1
MAGAAAPGASQAGQPRRLASRPRYGPRAFRLAAIGSAPARRTAACGGKEAGSSTWPTRQATGPSATGGP